MLPKRTGRSVCAACAVLFMACNGHNGIDDGYDCPQSPLNANLQHVLYWGEIETDVCTYRANKGYPVHAVGTPRWVDDNAVLTAGGILRNCEFESGMIRVDLDPTTHAFAGFTRFVYEGDIRIGCYDWIPETSEVVLVYYQDTWDPRISKATLEGGVFSLQPVIVGTEWQPAGVSHWPGHEGFAFYGVDPNVTKGGFYWTRGDDSEPDSLIVETDYIVGGGNYPFDFSADGNLLYAGFSEDASDTCVVRVYNLVDRTNEEIFRGRGAFVSLDVNADGTRMLLNRRSWWEPEDYIDIIDLDTGRRSRVDVRTRKYATCNFIVALYPAWSPTSKRFAFLGGWGSGEGDYAPYELWIRKLQ